MRGWVRGEGNGQKRGWSQIEGEEEYEDETVGGDDEAGG